MGIHCSKNRITFSFFGKDFQKKRNNNHMFFPRHKLPPQNKMEEICLPTRSSWVYIMANTITISHTGFCTLFAHRWVGEHLDGKQDCRNSKAVWLRKLKANAALIALLHLPFAHWDGIHSFPLTLCHCRRLVTSLPRPKVLTSATPAATIAFSTWNRCVGDDISCKPAEFHV